MFSQRGSPERYSPCEHNCRDLFHFSIGIAVDCHLSSVQFENFPFTGRAKIIEIKPTKNSVVHGARIKRQAFRHTVQASLANSSQSHFAGQGDL